MQAHLTTKLAVAKSAFKHDFPRVAVNRLAAFIGEVEVQRGINLTDQADDRWLNSTLNFSENYEHTGRQYYIGLRYTY